MAISDKDGLSPSQLADQENQPSALESDNIGSGYTNEGGGQGLKSGLINAVRQNKKGLLVGGGAAGGIVTIILVLIMSMIPLKIESIVSNLQSHFFSSSENAVQKESENMLSKYITRYVLPGLSTCGGSTIDRSCYTKISGTKNPITNLYKAWSNARLENKLATDYGLEFRAVKSGSTTKYYMKAPGILQKGGEDITTIASGSGDIFKEVDNAQVRQTVKDALSGETKWKQVMYRFKVGRLLEEKYGIKRCMFFCGTRDAFSKIVGEKKNAARLYLVQRVLKPLDVSKAVIITCLLDTTCQPTSTKPTTVDPAVNGELGGAAENPQTDTAIRTSLEALAAKMGVEDTATIEKLVKDYTTISEKGFAAYGLDKILVAVGLGNVSSQATDALPIIGQIKLVANIISDIHKLGPAIKKIGYISNAAAAVGLYMEYRTYADEIHTGHVDPTELGSMVNSLGPSNNSGSTSPELGGTAEAENTPLYSNLMGGGNSGTPSLATLFTPNVFAATTTPVATNSPTYLCNNGKPVPVGQLVCPEEAIGKGSTITNILQTINSVPGVGILSSLANIVSTVTGTITNLVGSLVTAIPGINSLSAIISKVISPVMSFVVNQLIPSPIGSNMSGGRTFDMMALGADVSGNDFAHTGLGGQLLTPAQVSEINAQQQNQALASFKQTSFFARIFNTSNHFSLISKLAMDLPSGNIAVIADYALADVLNLPLTILSTTSSLFYPHVAAQLSPQADPFGVPQYGYPTGTIPTDPSTYWQQNCTNPDSQNPSLIGGQTTQNWNQASTQNLDPNNEMPSNNTTDPCLLIEASVGSSGAIYDQSLLTPSDLGQTNAPSTTSSNALVWPFASKAPSQYQRIDQGWDLQTTPGGGVYAIASGTIQQYAPDPGGFGNNYPVEELDSSIGGPSNWIYYGHVHVISTLVGTHVNAGQLIAYTNTSQGENGSAAPPGWLEIGFAQPNTDAPAIKGAENTATSAGQTMNSLLLTAQPNPSASASGGL